MVDGVLGPTFAFAGAVARLTQLGFELAAVEDDLLVFRDTLQHDYERLEFVRTERSRKLHLLDSCTLGEIDNVLHNCQRACDKITVLVDEPLTRMKKKGSIRFGQRVEWVFRDSALAKALNDYRQTTHVSLMSVWTLLLQLQLQQSAHSPPSPYSKNVPAMQYNEYDQDLIESASKPRCSTIRAKSSPIQIEGIPVEETTSRWRTSSEESGSAGLGYGVVNRPQSARPPTTKSYEPKDHSYNDCEIGSILARREIALSRRHGSGLDLKKL
ncbi:hypothetical protein MMC31_003070 [Peltigera leucophlebia]|nr:hypothetical protein [Peltigera leucophlebia]